MERVEFRPIRRTAVRSLRPGDEVRIPLGPSHGRHGKITDLQENESARTITINGELVAEEGLFYHVARPNELVDRLIAPGEPHPGAESRLVRGDELWKWLGEALNDPAGSNEQYVLRTFARIENADHGQSVEVKLQSKSNPRKILTAKMKYSATIEFKGHR